MPIGISHVPNELDKQINSSRNLIFNAKYLGMPNIQVEIITELAFLRIFIAWENFLEESFIRYMMGAISPSRYKPILLVNPRNMNHALDIILAGREYVRWNSISEVINRAEIYFKDGEPFRTVLEGISEKFDNMNTIRNRIAHKSIISKNKFNIFIRSEFGHGIRGMTPGRLLLTLRHSTPRISYIDYYIKIIRTASRLIIK